MLTNFLKMIENKCIIDIVLPAESKSVRHPFMSCGGALHSL